MGGMRRSGVIADFPYFKKQQLAGFFLYNFFSTDLSTNKQTNKQKGKRFVLFGFEFIRGS